MPLGFHLHGDNLKRHSVTILWEFTKEIGLAGRAPVCHSSNSWNTSEALCPPNPNELLIAERMRPLLSICGV